LAAHRQVDQIAVMGLDMLLESALLDLVTYLFEGLDVGVDQGRLDARRVTEFFDHVEDLPGGSAGHACDARGSFRMLVGVLADLSTQEATAIADRRRGVAFKEAAIEYRAESARPAGLVLVDPIDRLEVASVAARLRVDTLGGAGQQQVGQDLALHARAELLAHCLVHAGGIAQLGVDQCDEGIEAGRDLLSILGRQFARVLDGLLIRLVQQFLELLDAWLEPAPRVLDRSALLGLLCEEPPEQPLALAQATADRQCDRSVKARGKGRVLFEVLLDPLVGNSQQQRVLDRQHGG
jgi:hypothetical protein